MAGSDLFSKQAPVKAHLVRGSGGLAGEIADLRDDVRTSLAPLAAITVEEFTNVVAATNDFGWGANSAVTPIVVTGGNFVLSPPRNITVTTAGSTPADAPATITVEGFDVNGDAMTETFNVAQTAATAAGVKAFARVTGFSFPAGEGTGATLVVGYGTALGLGKKLVTRAGYTGPVREIAAGAVVTTGTFVSAATSPPNGTYSPAAAPNGNNDYCLYYEYDPLACL